MKFPTDSPMEATVFIKFICIYTISLDIKMGGQGRVQSLPFWKPFHRREIFNPPKKVMVIVLLSIRRLIQMAMKSLFMDIGRHGTER